MQTYRVKSHDGTALHVVEFTTETESLYYSFMDSAKAIWLGENSFIRICYMIFAWFHTIYVDMVSQTSLETCTIARMYGQMM